MDFTLKSVSISDKQSECYLIAQDESIAVSLLDLSPPHQYAAGGGGECWDIGGAAGGDCSRR